MRSPRSPIRRPILRPSVDPPGRSLRRRDFFGFLAGVAAAAPFAAWMLDPRRGQCDAPAGSRPGAAAQAGWVPPLLTFVIPADAAKEYELGRLLGEYLNHGSDEALAPLAAVEVACTAEEELPAADVVEGQGPHAVRLTYFHPSLHTREIRFALPASPEQTPRHRDRATRRQHLATRIDAVSNAIRLAILTWRAREPGWPRAESLPHQARMKIAQIQAGVPLGEVLPELAASASLPGAAAPRAHAAKAGARVADEVPDIAPALLRITRSAQGSGRIHAMHALAEMARARLVRGVVPGSEWAVNGGCGTHVEDRPAEQQPDRGVACGMGHVPEESRRFLYFYTARRRENAWRDQLDE